MNTTNPQPGTSSSTAVTSAAESILTRARRGPGWFIGLVCGVFIAVGLVQLDGPFVSVHCERQNQTFDIARHVFRDGWGAVLTPKVTFSFPGYETKPYTVVRLEVPFYGVLAWPLAKLSGHERAAVRLLALIFGLASIGFLHAVNRHWLEPWPAAAGAALWAFSPLVLHLGQVPMPDILCTAAMLTSFWFALKGNLPLSSAAFLFSILAKVSAVPFGLPILVALLCTRKCNSLSGVLSLSICWGAAPLAGLLAWTSLEWMDPNLPWTMAKVANWSSRNHGVLSLRLYLFALVCLIPYGLGPLGLTSMLVTPGTPRRMDWRIKWAIVASNLVYLWAVVTKIPEFQYMLPPLAWAAIAAAFGIESLLRRLRTSWGWRVGLASLLCFQVVTVSIFTFDLKAPRVPDFAQISAAARLLPAAARVVVIYPFYGASPAIWLDRNVISLHTESEVDAQLPRLRELGFSHLVLMDMKLSKQDYWRAKLAEVLRGTRLKNSEDPAISHYADPTSSTRRYCDRHFLELFASPYVALYSLAGPEPGAATRP